MSKKPISEQTILITGASSGIGRATAMLAASQGANLILCARSGEILEEVCKEIEEKGGRAEARVLDVGDDQAMQDLGKTLKERDITVDTWINNAGASAYGLNWDIPMEEARRLFDTNYWGVVNGSLAALDLLTESRGTLINLGSVLSERAIPLQGHYSASKHAVKAFTESLRMEIQKENLPIDVCLIKPSAINTPYPEHAANHMEKAATVPPPVYAPEVVARAILRAAQYPQREVTVGGGGKMLTMFGNAAPALMDYIMNATMVSAQKRDRQAPASRQGALMHAIEDSKAFTARVHGNVETPVLNSSLYTWMKQRPEVSLAVAALGAGALGVWFSRDRFTA